MSWKLDSDRPIYAQIVERLQIQIVSGIYEPGAKLPSVRDLAMEAGVNPNTMQRAFMELERLNLVVTHRGSGRQVTEEIKMIKTVKNDLALNQVHGFLERMKELGFDRNEVIAFINDEMKEDTGND
jgi:DNA-binding transcriptional regulator YhcF (GntR family)